jgi:hypothetical protein
MICVLAEFALSRADNFSCIFIQLRRWAPRSSGPAKRHNAAVAQ